MLKPIALAACAIALFAATTAPALAAEAKPAPKANQCFWARSANGFAAADDRAVNIRVGVRDVYRFEFMGSCPDIDWTNSLALVSHGSDFICTGMDADIVTPSTIGPQRCPVRSVRKLTPDEIAALDKRARP